MKRLMLGILVLGELEEKFGCGTYLLVIIHLGDSRQHVPAPCGIPEEIAKHFVADNTVEC